MEGDRQYLIINTDRVKKTERKGERKGKKGREDKPLKRKYQVKKERKVM